MRANQFIPEAAIGTHPKRPSRPGSRPERGHEATPRYTTNEMDKSQKGPPGWNISDDEPGGKEHYVKPAKSKGVAKDALKSLNKEMDKTHDKVKEGSDERSQNALWAQITAHEKAAKKSKDLKQQHHLKMADQLRSQLKTVDEGEVVKFPKKHKGDLENTHDCPKCGGDLQGGKYMGHQVKVCMPCKQVYLPPNSGIDKQGNKVVDEIAGAFPSPSTKAKWAADAAASNAAEAKRQELLKAQQLQKNTAEVDRLQKINHHSLDATIPEVAMRMQGSSQSEKDATAREKARQAEELAKHQAIVKAYVDIMSKGQPLPPKMQQSYNTMPDFRKEVDAALAKIPGRPGEIDLLQRVNHHLLPKNEAMEAEVDRILADLEEGGAQGPTPKKVCLSSVSDEALGVSQLASCKSQGLRARDGKKSHLIGHGNSKVRVVVGGKKIKGKAHGGPLPDYGTRKGQ